jgi:UDP-N-acetylmuramyl pentapeptide phosphotransferase/UDP-N-acetylglucosamine-1-phosphate transferase
VTLLAIACVVTALAAPAVRWLMLHHGVVDVPNHRSSHTLPTPRGGGWACVAGVVVALAVGVLRDTTVPVMAAVAPLALALVGFADDRRSLSPVIRLASQLVIGAAVGAALGGPVAAVVGALLFPGVVNVVNFMDGINGISAITMAVWGGTALAVGLHWHAPSLWVIGAVTAGAALGFLPWNAPVARLFLGDIGSYLFGALAATGMLIGWHHGAPVAVLVAPLAVYLADTATTLIARTRRREPLLEAHRSHVYQGLVSGPSRLPHLAVSLYAGGLAAAATLAWAYLPMWVAGLATLAVVGLYLSSPVLLNGRQFGSPGSAAGAPR